MRIVLVLTLFAACATKPPAPARQNPSPMVESTREHARVKQRELAGKVLQVEGAQVLVTPAAAAAGGGDLVIHFHGASWLPMQEAESSNLPLVVASVNIGAGSRRYSMAFEDPAAFAALRARIVAVSPPVRRTFLTAFSAGYGAIREILRQQADAIDGVLLLDGLHASYIPDAKPVAEGGVVDTRGLAVFVEYGRRAVAGDKRFVVTHSEIFPGTFASTTETADHILRELGMKRTPVMKWGPLGMQQLSEASSGRFVMLGFAGNTAPDHVDHLHAYATFLQLTVGD